MAELREIQYLTDEMLTCAEQGEWDLLIDMEQTRGKKIVEMFEPIKKERPSTLLLKWYEDLKQKDREIKMLCEVRKSELMKNMGQFNRGKQVSAAYTSA